jgi:hypothetical protein
MLRNSAYAATYRSHDKETRGRAFDWRVKHFVVQSDAVQPDVARVAGAVDKNTH